jgi:predicted  nucleic acid-binding Zn-ribbon protein
MEATHVNPEIESLLALQAEDGALEALERKLDGLEPRARELDRVRRAAEEALARARVALEAEEKRQSAMQHRVAEHKQLHARNVQQLETVRKMRDATAATSQVEQAREILAAEESELETIGRRMGEMRMGVESQERALAVLDEEQRAAREALAADRASIEGEIAAARAQRDGTAARVSRGLLGRYDRIRQRRKGHGDAVYALRGPSCGNCDTAIPLQRRTMMLRTGAIEPCEACGVLLYATG